MHTRFWEDRWLDGSRIQDVAPAVYALVEPSARASRTVFQALSAAEWARDVGPELSVQALNEYMALWDRLDRVHLNQEEVDSISWACEANGDFSTRSAYEAKFMGREVTPMAGFTWKSRAPLRCRFFAWLTLQNRCWTSDRLARHGLDHQEACPFCAQHEETIDHILMDCVFAREVWSSAPLWASMVGCHDWARA